MSNAFFVPFNHQPTSAEVKTAAYTLGANEYARLVPMPHTSMQSDNNAGGDQSIRIDGTVVIPQTHWGTSDMDATDDITINASGILYLLCNNPAFFELKFAEGVIPGTDARFKLYYDNSASAPSSSGVVSIPVHAGSVINFKLNGSDNFYAWLEPFEEIPKELWLPPSTAITSGDGTLIRPYWLEIYTPYS